MQSENPLDEMVAILENMREWLIGGMIGLFIMLTIVLIWLFWPERPLPLIEEDDDPDVPRFVRGQGQILRGRERIRP